MRITDYKIILASASPRRQDLLSGIDLTYELRTLPDIDESFPDDLPHEEVAEYLARKKAAAYLAALRDDELLITADTVVLLDEAILGKPADREDARRMLALLSGIRHRVITGVCLTSLNKRHSFSDRTWVTFGNLTGEEIDYYLDRYSPMDKAGAYGVQEWIGYVGVKRIEGSYFNVMGFPIYKVYRELKQF